MPGKHYRSPGKDNKIFWVLVDTVRFLMGEIEGFSFAGPCSIVTRNRMNACIYRVNLTFFPSINPSERIPEQINQSFCQPLSYSCFWHTVCFIKDVRLVCERKKKSFAHHSPRNQFN